MLGLMAFTFFATGCSDSFLEKYPESNYTGESYYSSDKALSKACEPLYNRAWFNFNRRAMVGMGSYRANDAWNPYVSAEFARFTTTALTAEVVQAWSSLYTVVTMSNSILHDVTYNCGSAVTEAAKNRALGEAYLMRATSYFYMVRIWGPVILFENNDEVVLVPHRPVNPEEDVFKFVIRDLRKAADLLPDQGSNGRVSKYAAKAMLAKVLLAHSGWNKGGSRDESELAECITLCEDVIDHSGASLMDDFEQLFRSQNNNNSETLFAMQWADPLVGEWGECNALLSDISFSDVCDVNCWGNNIQASVDMIKMFNEDPADSIRLRATFFTEGRHYDYIKSASGGYTYNKRWMQLKKGVVGSKEDTDGHLDMMKSPLNTYILRLADVYLTHAEASLGNKSEITEGRGWASFNTIRRRAKVGELPKVTLENIIRERRIEFCMEYCNWFDMVSWYRWKPEYMLDYFNNKQYRGYEIQNDGIEMKANKTFRYWLVNYTVDEEKIWSDSPSFSFEEYLGFSHTNAGVEITSSSIFMPYPEADRLQNPYLSQAPQPYEFSE